MVAIDNGTAILTLTTYTILDGFAAPNLVTHQSLSIGSGQANELWADPAALLKLPAKLPTGGTSKRRAFTMPGRAKVDAVWIYHGNSDNHRL